VDEYDGDKVCDNKTLTLSTATSINPAFNSSVSYVWEYIINNEKVTVLKPNPDYCGNIDGICSGGGGTQQQFKMADVSSGTPTTNLVEPGGEDPPCCFEPEFIEEDVFIWRSLGTTSATVSNGNISFDVRTLYSLDTISENAIVNFRVKAMANSMQSVYAGPSLTLNVSPLPPTINNIAFVASCPNQNTGEIHFSNVSGLGAYKYLLKPGHNNNLSCDPADDSCFSGENSGSVSGTDVVI
jgi:hypothetical protein